MTTRVFGTVYDASTGAVITTATVSAPPYNVVNTNGSYSITIASGTIGADATASAPDYLPATKHVSASNGTTKQFDFQLTHV